MSNLLPYVQNQISQLTLNIEHLSKDITLVQSHLEQKFTQLKRESIDDGLTILIEQLKQQNDTQQYNNQKRFVVLEDNKMDQKEAFQMMDSNRVQIYDDVSLLKNELTYQKMHFEELLNEKIKRIDTVSLQESVQQLKDQIKMQKQEENNQFQENQVLMKQLLNANKKSFFQELERITQQITELKSELNEQNAVFVKKQEIETIQIQFRQQLELKSDLIEVQNALNSSQVDIATRFQEFKDEVKTVLELQSSEFFTLLNRKVNQAEMNNLMANKVDLQTLLQHTDNKVPLKEFQYHVNLVENIALDLQKKCQSLEFEQFREQQMLFNEELREDLTRKLSKTNFKEILDRKANHEDVSKAFLEMQQLLNKKLQSEDFKIFQSNQSQINEQLCGEHIIARWQFKANFLSPGSLVPWNLQSINNLQDNYLWEKDKPNIIVVSPGLYEIHLGFFAKKKPKIDIMVNGETIIGAVNNSSYVIHHSSGKLKDTKSSMTGLTMMDFIMLPARSRINIAYQGDLGEGFMSLRKL